MLHEREAWVISEVKSHSWCGTAVTASSSRLAVWLPSCSGPLAPASLPVTMSLSEPPPPWLQAGTSWGSWREASGWKGTVRAAGRANSPHRGEVSSRCGRRFRNGTRALSHCWGIPLSSAETTGRSSQKGHCLCHIHCPGDCPGYAHE